jgi:small subunit ribosomal protein S3
MGRNTNPKILRVGNILRSWDAKWFADRRPQFRDQLRQDLFIRRYFAKNLRLASISRLEILRQPRETVLTIHTSRPAIVIGRGGSGIEKIQKDLKMLLGLKSKIRINVQEVANPDIDAVAVATQVVDQLERRMPFRRILKQSIQRSMQAGARGIKISLAGRLNGSEIARTEWLAEGNVPLHTFRSDISYCCTTAFTTYGTIGIKVWINRGMLEVEQEQPGEAVAAPVAKPAPARSRKSLADQVKGGKRAK